MDLCGDRFNQKLKLEVEAGRVERSLEERENPLIPNVYLEQTMKTGN